MWEAIRKLFGARTECAVCARKDHEIAELQEMLNFANSRIDLIEDLRDEIRYLRAERAEVQGLLNRAMRLESGSTANVTQNPNPISVSPRQSWANVRQKLENAHRKSPEDKTAEYWHRKNEQLAHDAGINPEVPNAS